MQGLQVLPSLQSLVGNLVRRQLFLLPGKILSIESLWKPSLDVTGKWMVKMFVSSISLQVDTLDEVLFSNGVLYHVKLHW